MPHSFNKNNLTIKIDSKFIFKILLYFRSFLNIFIKIDEFRTQANNCEIIFLSLLKLRNFELMYFNLSKEFEQY